MAIKVEPLVSNNAPALELAVSWEDGQFVMIVTKKGLVSCGIVDMAVMEEFGAAIAVAKGTPERPLKTADDLLSARIVDLTKKASLYGVNIGMTGKEALEKLSD